MAVPGLGWLSALFASIAGYFTVRANKQEADKREEAKESGRNEQRVTDNEVTLKQANKQNALEEDYAKLSGDALDDRVSKSME